MPLTPSVFQNTNTRNSGCMRQSKKSGQGFRRTRMLAAIAPHIRTWPDDCTPHPGRRSGYLDKVQRRQPWGTQQGGERMEHREAVMVPRAACRPCGGLRRTPAGRKKLAGKPRVKQSSSERIRRLQASSYTPAKQVSVFRRFQEGCLEALGSILIGFGHQRVNLERAGVFYFFLVFRVWGISCFLYNVPLHGTQQTVVHEPYYTSSMVRIRTFGPKGFVTDRAPQPLYISTIATHKLLCITT